MNNEITRDQLLDLLESFVGKGRSCTLYMRTDENHLIIIGLDHGEIVALTSGPKRGERAIPLVRDMQRARYRLEDGVTVHRSAGAGLPPSRDLLALLRKSPSASTVRADESSQILDILCRIAGGYLGPIAPVVCKEAISNAGGLETVDQLRQIVDALSREIEDASESTQFRAQVLRELGHRMD